MDPAVDQSTTHVEASRPTNVFHDLEKNIETVDSTSKESDVAANTPTASLPVPKTFSKWNERIENLAGLEARGIQRVMPEERHGASAMGYLQMLLLWFSANISVNNLAVGLLGPLVYNLGFLDCAICTIFGVILGSLSTAYMSIWGAQSGNRTMIMARYFMGYWPSKIACILNIVLMVGYCTIDCIIGGQMLSAVSGDTMTIAVGVVVVGLVVWIIAVFGMSVFHIYERFAWLPQVIVLMVLVGSAGPNFNPNLQSVGSGATLAANRLSFLSLSLYVPNSWGGAASDFYVYYPENTTKWKVFWLTFTGLTLSFSFVNMLGIGLATGIATTPAWSDAYNISSGALIVSGYGPLAGFGKFCSVIVALGVIANSVPGTYSAALGCQVLGRYGKAVPRYMWVCVLVVIELTCALAGRDNLFVIFQNFLALMGYWVEIFVCIVLEEHFLFRRHFFRLGFDWTGWENKKVLPVGIAALIAFLLGWMGAILGMYQVWYVGPIAKLIGDGCDVGLWIGCAITLIAFPPLRYLEVKKFGR